MGVYEAISTCSANVMKDLLVTALEAVPVLRRWSIQVIFCCLEPIWAQKGLQPTLGLGPGKLKSRWTMAVVTN